MNDIDILRQMYATLCGGIDAALTLLEVGNVWEAKVKLQAALHTAEDMHIGAEESVDELSERRCGRP